MKTRKVFQYLYIEGALAMAYDSWLGQVYMSGLAGELGISIEKLVWVATLPWIGAVGSLLGYGLLKPTSPMRELCLKLAWLGRSLWIVPLSLALFWSFTAGTLGAFPKQLWFTVLVSTALCVSLLANIAGVAWLAWMKQIVPRAFLGRFMGRRQQMIMSAVVVANGAATLILNIRFEGVSVGYAILGGVAFLFGLGSTWFLSKVPGPKKNQNKAIAQTTDEPLTRSDTRLTRPFILIALSGAIYNGAQQFAGPYFPYFFTKDLKISLSQVAFWSLMSNVGCLLLSQFWGKWVDRTGSASRVWFICGVFLALSPLPYAVFSRDLLLWIGPIEYLINGAAWSGYTIALMSQLYRNAPIIPARAFALYTALAGIMGALGAMAGNAVSQHYGRFEPLWYAASALRMTVVLCLIFPHTLFNSPKVKKITV